MKFSNYYTIIETSQCMILYSTLRKCAIKIYDTDIKDIIRSLKGGVTIDNDYLTKYTDFFEDLKVNNFVIEDICDESELVNFLYQSSVTKDTSLELILIPTRQCNFRCQYCYEEHEAKVMGEEVYTNILSFIKRYFEYRTIDKLRISWFGGEPTLEHRKIINFMKKLKSFVNESCSIEGSMTTNGYLLNEDLFNELLSCNVNSYQITIDGLREFHDKTRFLSGGYGTWDKIMGNLLKAKNTSRSFRILIRTNYTEESILKYREWLNILKDSFGDDERFAFYCETVKDLGGSNTRYAYNNKKPDPIGSVLSDMKSLNLNSSGYEYLTNNFSYICYASRQNSFVIDFDGTLKKCTVLLDSDKNIIGNIGNQLDSIDFKKTAWWTSYNHKEECRSCYIYPICYGKKCPASYFSKDSCRMFKEYQHGVIRSVVQEI